MTQAKAAALAATRNMEELISVLGETGMGPGWAKPEPSLWPSPRQNFVPAHWSYAVSKPALDAAGKYVSTELAERRNLILYNPIPGNNYATVRTLISAYQMVMPHETARSHRHSPNALRLVVDTGAKAYTIVAGKKIPMLPGDVLLTPNWAWHGHSNEGDERAYWIDFLDVPTMHFLEAMFFESYPDGIEKTDVVDAASPYRFPFDVSRKRLDEAADAGPGHRCIELGPPHMETVGLRVHRIEGKSTVSPAKTTANSVFAVMEGSGATEIDGARFEWARGDVIAAPAWRSVRHEAKERSFLLQVTDEPLFKKLNWLRTEG